MNSITPPSCPTCHQPAEFLATSERIYNGRDYGSLWACLRGCDAYVSVQPGTRVPKGTLATKPMRVARRAAHALFDDLWLDLTPAYPDVTKPSAFMRTLARERAYRWLAAQLGISFNDCHIAMFDQAQCERVVQVINEQKPTSATVRAWFKSQQGQAA